MKVVCPGCQKGLNMKDEFAGRSGKCPACGAVLTIPAKPAREDPGAPPEPAAKGVTVCETHENKRIIARCTVCGRGVCKKCRDEFGYYCSEACREKGRRRSLAPTEQEEQRQLSDFGRKMDRWIRIAKWRVLPAAAALVVLVIVYRATSDLGEPVWEFKPPGDRPFSPITLSHGTIFAGCGKVLHAIDARSGKEQWTFEAEGDLSTSKPVTAGKGLCVTWDKAFLYCLDAAKGKLVWKHVLAGELGWGPAAGAGVVVAVCDLYREPTDEERREAARMNRTGRSWADPTRLPSHREGAAVSGVALRSGKELWSVRLAKGSACGGLALKGKRLYLCWDEPGEKGTQAFLALLDPASGRERWRARLSSSGAAGTVAEGIAKTPRKAVLGDLGSLGVLAVPGLAGLAWGCDNALVPAGEGVLVTSAGGLAYFSSEGKELWKTSQAPGFGAPVVAGDMVYLRGMSGVECLKLASGKRLWSADAGGPASRPVVAGGLVLVSTHRTEAIKGLKPKATIELPKPKAEGLEDIQGMMDSIARQPGPRERTLSVLCAFDAATGEPAWTADEAGGEIFCSGKWVFAVDTRGTFNLMDACATSVSKVTAIRASSGRILWQHWPKGSVASVCATKRAFILSSRIVSTHTSAMSSGRQSTTDNAITAISLRR